MNKHIETIQKLLEVVNKTNVAISEIELSDEKGRIRLSLKQEFAPNYQAPIIPVPSQPASFATPAGATPSSSSVTASTAPSSASTTVADTPQGVPLLAPMVGTVYLAPSPGAEPFLKVGQSIKKGDTICLIEAMKMFNKVEAEHSGKVVACLVKNAQAVEFDQTLFIIDTDNAH